jgi:hypothetical protein
VTNYADLYACMYFINKILPLLNSNQPRKYRVHGLDDTTRQLGF